MSLTSIVVPCYNEAERLDASAFLCFAAANPGVFFHLVDDGSTDSTLDLLKMLQTANPSSFGVLHLDRNRGKGEAVRSGLLAALEGKCDFVGYWDADLATPLHSISAFQNVLEDRPGTDLVLGARVRLLGRRIERRALRHYLGRVFATGASLALRLPVYDTQCGAKLFRVTPMLRPLLAEPFRSRWVFDVELIARILNGVPPADRQHDRRLYELPLAEWTDVGRSRVRAWDFGLAAIDLLSVYLRYGIRHRQWLSAPLPSRCGTSPLRDHAPEPAGSSRALPRPII
jgi:dolichyl-phosphate beta-glucosyltransferase